jgi:putative ABC transport system permease protein
MSNADYIIKGLIFFIGRGRSRQAVLKTAISYALKSKFKTGMTVAIFSLVIFTITTMSMIVGMMGTNIENQVQKSSGGYEIMAFCNPNAPIQDIDQELKIKELDHNIEKTSAPITGRVRSTITDIFGDVVYYTLIGIDDQFIIENEFEFVQIIDEYENAQDAWDAIRDNSSLVIIDASIIQNQYGPQQNVFTVELGDIIGLQGKDNIIRSKKIIGILDTTYVRGLFSYESHVSEEFGFTNSTVFLFSVIEGQDVDKVSKQIESSFLKNGMQAFAIKSMVMEAIKAINQFFNLFNAFMGLGLIIGIAGLGVITIRSVHERRQQIGMMRAIGFQKRMILTTFLIETSTIALLGIIIGTLLGVFTGYLIWRDGFQQLDFDFIVNWVPILMMSTIAFFFTLICIFPSSKKASTIPPAEALRYEG